jgi:hypothetical protein
MRVLLLLSVIASGLGAVAAVSPAHAWYDRWGRWHPDYHRHHYPPPGYYGDVPPPGYWEYYPPPPYARPPVYAPRPPLPYYGPFPPVYPRY